MVTLHVKDQGVEFKETNLRFTVFASVPSPNMAPTYDLEWGFLCRDNASEISSYLHSSGRIKQTAVAKCRANYAYARHLISAVAFRATCQQELCGPYWCRHYL
jgi:hypothetical protein